MRVAQLIGVAVVGCSLTTTAMAQECVRVAGTDWTLEAQSVDPIVNSSFGDVLRITTLYEKLVDLDNSYQPIPVLAESWSSNDAGTVWTFNLRQGVKFHDGSVLTAADVVYSILRAADPETGSQGASVLEFLKNAQIEAVDDSTLRITLDAPQVELPILISTKYTAVVPAGSTRESLQKQPIGTGPFKIEGGFEQGGQSNTLVANPDYWQPGLPKAPCIEITGITDSVARISALVSGEVDLLVPIDPTAKPTLDEYDNIQILASPGGSVMTLSMWADTPPFDDVRVRQAMKLVVNREALVEIAILNAGSPGNDNPVPPTSPDAYRSDVIERDIDRARELLAAAGHPDGLEVDLYTSEALPGMYAIAQVYSQMAMDAGITVNVLKTPSESYWDDVWLKRSFITSSWGGRPAGEGLSIAYLCSTNMPETHWCNEEFDSLIAAANSTADADERRKLYQAAQKLLAEDGGVIVPAFLASLAAFRSECSGYEPNNNLNNQDWSQLTCK